MDASQKPQSTAHVRASGQLRVYFDGLCPLCSREIELYRRRPGAERICWIDITLPGFDAIQEGLDPKRVHARFHVKATSGEVLEGVDAFVEIWRTLPSLQTLARLASLPGVRPLLRLGYAVFARIRPYLPRKVRSLECADDACRPSASDRRSPS